jgi:putative redox protein
MEMLINFPGGARVDAHFDVHNLKTDQPPAGGGEGSAPTPFDTFLASIGTCAGIYVLGFCRQRGIPTEDVRILQRAHHDPATGMISKIDLEIQTPPGFPEKYLPALVRAADQCKVKKHLEKPPKFEVYTKTV